MATLAAQFKAALGNIEPEDDASNAADAHKHVHDLAMLFNARYRAAPTSDLDVSLIDKPTITWHVPARSRSLDELRREALYPPVHGHMIDLDPTLDQQLLDIAVREAKPQVPPCGCRKLVRAC